MEITHSLIAILLGVVPAVLWLLYWTREDRLHPEPKRLLLLTFIAGGVTVAFVIPIQQLARTILGHDISPQILIAWAGIEEVMKLLVALVVVLWRRAVDEPIDMMIYMLTLALGFSAVENSLFLINPQISTNILSMLVVGNFRFFGATLVHLLSSSLIGLFMALSFYKKEEARITYAVVGLLLAIVVHSLFNIFLLNNTGHGIMVVFAFVWIGIVMLLLFFEKIKKMTVLPYKYHLKK